MKNTNILGTVVVAILIVALFAMPAFSAGATKHAVAGSTIEVVEAQTQPDGIVILETQIRTGNPKDLIISFTSEAALVTDTKISGKDASDMDRASIIVWATVDGNLAYPENGITLAERTQTLKGNLGQMVDPDTGLLMDEDVQLILDTTAANGFNFYIENVGTGNHVVQIWAKISTEESTGTASGAPKGIIGSRTLIVEEVDLK